MVMISILALAEEEVRKCGNMEHDNNIRKKHVCRIFVLFPGLMFVEEGKKASQKVRHYIQCLG